MPEITIDDRATHRGSPKSVRHYDIIASWETLKTYWAWLRKDHRCKLYCKGTSVIEAPQTQHGMIVFQGGDGYTHKVKPDETVYVDLDLAQLDQRIAELLEYRNDLSRMLQGEILPQMIYI